LWRQIFPFQQIRKIGQYNDKFLNFIKAEKLGVKTANFSSLAKAVFQLSIALNLSIFAKI